MSVLSSRPPWSKMEPPMHDPKEYVEEIWKLFKDWQKNKSINPNMQSVNYGAKNDDIISIVKANNESYMPALNKYLSVAKVIMETPNPPESYAASLQSRLAEYLKKRQPKDFFVMCCPSMTGKTQFAFTLKHPTVYIPFSNSQNVYQPFRRFYEALLVAAYKDLAKCYKLFFASTTRTVFDPIISATNFDELFKGGTSYVLGFFAYIQTLLAGQTNAITCTEALLKAIEESQEKRLVFSSIRFDEFSERYAASPFFVIIDEFPTDGLNKVLAVFIRNILRSQFAALIIMSTSAKITNMVSPGNTIETGSGKASENIKWATLIRILPPVSIDPLLQRYNFSSLDGFMRVLKVVLELAILEQLEVSEFCSVLKLQLVSSRPGLSDIVIRSVAELLFKKQPPKGKTHDNPSLKIAKKRDTPKIHMESFVTLLLDKLNENLKGRKDIMFRYPGIRGSMNLVFPNSKIHPKLHGPTASIYINNHLYFLANPNKDKGAHPFVDLFLSPKDIRVFHEDLSESDNTSEEQLSEIDAFDYEDSSSDRKSGSDDLSESDSILSSADSNEMEGLSDYTDDSQSIASVFSSLNHSDSSATLRRGTPYATLPLFTKRDCLKSDLFIIKSEMPNPDKELFSYLGCWAIGNSFFEKAGSSVAFVPQVLSLMKEYIEPIRAIAPSNPDNPANDGLVAEALTVQSFLFSSHFVYKSMQNGLPFLFRLLMNTHFRTQPLSIVARNNSFADKFVDGKIKVNGSLLQKVSINGRGGDLMIESNLLATKFGNLRVPYLGPIGFQWRELLNGILPKYFGNVVRPKNQRKDIGNGMDFQFEYFDGVNEDCKIAEVEVKDHRQHLGVDELCEVLKRISEGTEIHFLFTRPVSRTISSCKNMQNYLSRPALQRGKRGADKSPVMPVENEPDLDEGSVGGDVHTEVDNSQFRWSMEIGEGNNLGENSDISGNVEILTNQQVSVSEENEELTEEEKKELRKIFERKKINLYCVNFVETDFKSNDFTLSTIHELSENTCFSIIVPLIPATMTDLSTREVNELVNRLEKISMETPRKEPRLQNE